jgi:hypothetical protein
MTRRGQRTVLQQCDFSLDRLPHAIRMLLLGRVNVARRAKVWGWAMLNPEHPQGGFSGRRWSRV